MLELRARDLTVGLLNPCGVELRLRLREIDTRCDALVIPRPGEGDSTFVGCGTKKCTTNSPGGPGFPNWIIVVCNYAPPGNVTGQRPY